MTTTDKDKLSGDFSPQYIYMSEEDLADFLSVKDWFVSDHSIEFEDQNVVKDTTIIYDSKHGGNTMTYEDIVAQAKAQSLYFSNAQPEGDNATLTFGREIRCQVSVPTDKTTPETLKHAIERADRAVGRELLAQSGLTVNALANMEIVWELRLIRNTILRALGLSPEDLNCKNPEDMKCKYDLAPQDLYEIQWALNFITDQCTKIGRACIVTPIMDEK